MGFFSPDTGSDKCSPMTRGPYVETEVSFELGCSCGEAFALMSDMKRFPSFFTGYGPIPPVVHCELLTAAPVQVGSKRLITNGDGSALEELVQVYSVDHEQLYRIEKGFVAPFSWMVCAAEGHWQFKPSEEGTLVTWSYRFELTTLLVMPIVGFIVHGFFRRAMMRCLKNMGNAAEASRP